MARFNDRFYMDEDGDIINVDDISFVHLKRKSKTDDEEVRYPYEIISKSGAIRVISHKAYLGICKILGFNN